MVKEPYSWVRFKKFYRRNDIAFWCAGLIIFGHVFWWEIQQNKAFVPKHDRVRKVGPFTVPYLDELEAFKKSPPPPTA